MTPSLSIFTITSTSTSTTKGSSTNIITISSKSTTTGSLTSISTELSTRTLTTSILKSKSISSSNYPSPLNYLSPSSYSSPLNNIISYISSISNIVTVSVIPSIQDTTKILTNETCIYSPSLSPSPYVTQFVTPLISYYNSTNVLPEQIYNTSSIMNSQNNENSWISSNKMFVLYGFFGSVILLTPILICSRKYICKPSKRRRPSLLPTILDNPLYTNTSVDTVYSRRRSISEELINKNKVKANTVKRSSSSPLLTSLYPHAEED